MADTFDNPSRRKKHNIDWELKRTRDRFRLKNTQAAIIEALDAASDLTIFDRDFLFDQLGKRRALFKHASNTKQFRAEIVAWITKRARCIAQFRAMLPSLKVDDRTATLLYLRLPEFTGTDEEFSAWMRAAANHEREGINELGNWIRVHASAVRAGIWKVLADCRDLEGCIDDVADELFSMTWMHVADNITKFMEPAEALPARLYVKAYWLARAWKSKRLAEIEQGIRPKPVMIDGIEELESQLAYYAGSGKLPPRPVVLGPGDDAAFEPVHPGLADFDSFELPCDYLEMKPDDATVYAMAA